MLKSRVLFIAFAAALLGLFAAPAANAAYAPPPFTADVPDSVAPGEEFTVTFDAGSVNCAWTLAEFNGQSAPAATGTTYTVTLTAPEEDGTYTITANCTWDPETTGTVSYDPTTSDASAVTPAVYNPAASASSDTLLAVPQTDTYSVQLVVGDGGDDDNGGNDDSDDSGVLPNTGGSNLTLLAAGAGLVVVGAGVTIAARRRKTA